MYKTGDCLNENNLYTTTHQFLGYSPKPNNINTCTLTYKDSLIYDITYSIDKNGYRITPDKKDNDCVWIYGGSYTYGEGVNDKHSMPYVIGANHIILKFTILDLVDMGHIKCYHIFKIIRCHVILDMPFINLSKTM